MTSRTATTLAVVDSCGWLAYWGGEPTAEFFAPPLIAQRSLIVPAITVFEVCKRVLQSRGEAAAELALRAMQQGRVVQLDAPQLYAAAQAADKYKIAMTDALVWHTAQLHHAQLYTQDAGLKDLPNVRFIAKVPAI